MTFKKKKKRKNSTNRKRCKNIPLINLLLDSRQTKEGGKKKKRKGKELKAKKKKKKLNHEKINSPSHNLLVKVIFSRHETRFR